MENDTTKTAAAVSEATEVKSAPKRSRKVKRSVPLGRVNIQATFKAAEIAKNNYGLTKVDVFVKGVGLGRDAAVRALMTHDLIIESINDKTGVPHGGVRPKRERRA